MMTLKNLLLTSACLTLITSSAFADITECPAVAPSKPNAFWQPGPNYQAVIGSKLVASAIGTDDNKTPGLPICQYGTKSSPGYLFNFQTMVQANAPDNWSKNGTYPVGAAVFCYPGHDCSFTVKNPS